MSALSSARAQVQVDDSIDRATKKVKARDKCEGDPSGGTEEEQRLASFREALLNVPGLTDENATEEEEWVDMNDEDMPENRWYKEPVEPVEQVSPEGQVPVVHVSDAEISDWCEKWNQTLVVHVLGKKVNYRVLENKVNRDWARDGKVKIIDMPRGFYAVNFESLEDYKHVLFEGPWMVADHYLLVQRWRPNFLRSARVESKIAVWVRIPELPLELYNRTFLERLGKSLGTFMKIDHLTSIQSRGQFARICVEIDLAKPLQPKVFVRGEALKLEYEGLHSVCFSCGVYGHRVETCPKKNLSNQMAVIPSVQSDENGYNNGGSKGAEEESQGNDGLGSSGLKKQDSGKQVFSNINGDGNLEANLEADNHEAAYGPWMLVKKGIKKRKGPSIASKTNKAADRVGAPQSQNLVGKKDKGSRFEVLSKQGEKKSEQVDMEVESCDVDGSASGAQPNPLVGETIEKSSNSPTNGSRTRNLSGGKNPQFGPRIREVKKAARAGGMFKKISQVVGPRKSKGKENIQPNGKVLIKGKPLFSIETKSVTESPHLGVEHPFKGATDGKIIPSSQSKEFHLDTGGDTNPLLGFIDSCDFEGQGKEQFGKQKLANEEISQSGTRLSESNPQNGSK